MEESEFHLEENDLLDAANEKVSEELSRIKKYVDLQVKKKNMKEDQVNIVGIQEVTIKKMCLMLWKLGLMRNIAQQGNSDQNAKRGRDYEESLDPNEKKRCETYHE